jgi:predicted HTH transcriptional regulator
MAMIMASMANAKGGFLIFGVKEKPGSAIDVSGLSNDFKVTSVVHKALEKLSPKPEVF